MSSLRLALRGLRARAGLSAALLAVTTFAVGVAAAGAIYLRAAGESLLAQNLRTATSYTAGLHVSQVVADGRELRSLTGSLAAARPAVPALDPPVTGLETRTPVPILAEGGRPANAYLAGRDGLCDHLVLQAGRCPGARPLGLPAEAAVSRRAADWLRLDLGDRFRVEGFGAGAAGRDLVVAGIYSPTPRDQFWFGAQPAYFPPPPLDNEQPPMDAVFLANADLLPVVDNGTMDIRARFDHFSQPDRVRLADARTVPAALAEVAEVLRINNPNATVLTGLADLVAKAEADRQALTVPVLLAEVQLAALALLILVVVAAMTAEARAGEVALAKVRGATTGQAFGLAVLELVVVAALALPAGLAVACWARTCWPAASSRPASRWSSPRRRWWWHWPPPPSPLARPAWPALARSGGGSSTSGAAAAPTRWPAGGSCSTWCCCWSPPPPWPTCAPPGRARPPAATTCSPPSPPAWPCWPPPWSSAARCRWSRAGWSGSPAARPGWPPGSGPARWPAAAARPCGW
jgi:FtsX-like permease family